MVVSRQRTVLIKTWARMSMYGQKVKIICFTKETVH